MTDGFEDRDGGWHRVHWFGLIELGVGAAIGFGLLVLTGLPSSIGAWAEELFAAFAGIRALVAYFHRRYRVTPTVVTSTSGVWFRTEESMRRGDVQSVSTTVPVWYRPFNLARLIISDGSGNHIEIGPLKAALAEGFQQTMRPDLHSMDGGDTRSDLDVTEPAAVESGAVDSTAAGAADLTDPGHSQLVRRIDIPMWKLIAVTVGDVSLVLILGVLAVIVYNRWWIAFGAVLLLWLSWVVIEVGSTMRFQLTLDDDVIRTDRGWLVNQDERTTRDRVEFLRVDETLVGRLLGVERVAIGTGDDVIMIAPAQERGEWLMLAGVLFGVRDDPPIENISGRSLGRFRLRGAFVTAVVGGGASYWGPLAAVLAAGVVGLVLVGWYPRARLARFGLGRNGQLLVARRGFAPRQRWLFRVDRIDATIRQATIGQRRAGLATISFSGRGLASKVTVPDLDERQATDWDRHIADVMATRIEADRRERSEPVSAGAGQAVPVPADSAVSARFEQPLPAAAIRLNAWISVSIAVVLLLAWAGAAGFALSTSFLAARWRSPWLIGAASIVFVVVAVLAVRQWMDLARSEHWSVDQEFVDRRVGVIVRTSTRVKFGHVAAARWSQGPLERRFGLATVRLFTRGTGNPDLILGHLDESDARALAELHRSLLGSADP